MIPFAVKRWVYYGFQKGRTRMFGCIFCQIASHEKSAGILYEDDQCLAIQDLHPKAPVHLLIIPRKHITSLNDNLEGEELLLGHMLGVAARMAREKGIEGSGYRTVINTNAEGGQTVFHLHMHLMGGRVMKWPPG
jgi:histidine triad (HIT) family protein